jgi:hypothetical protein
VLGSRDDEKVDETAPSDGNDGGDPDGEEE